MDDDAEKPSTEPQPDLLPLDRYAEICAHLVHFKGGDRGEVVSRLGVSSSDWDRGLQHWTAAIGDELSRGDLTLTLAMGPVFGAKKARLEAEQPTVESLGPRLEDLVPAPAAPMAAAAATPALEPPRDEPSPVAAPAAPTPVATAVPSFMLQPKPSAAVPSFLLAGEAPAMSPPAMVAPAMEPSHAGLIPPMVASEHREPTPPFQGAKGRSGLHGTSLALEVPKGAPVPFQEPRPTSRAIDTAKQHAEHAQGPKQARPGVGGGTEISSDVAAIARKILPFGGANEPARQPAAPKAPHVAASQAPVMSVEQYASLCVEIALAPSETFGVLRRYGLTESTRKSLDDHWELVFKNHPTQYLAWDRACKAYRAWLESTRGGER